ncbi:MAG: hypothetical protein ABIA74_03665 [bacterium]
MNIFKTTSKIGLSLFLVTFLFGCKFLDFGKKSAPTETKEVEVSGGSGVVLLNINGKPSLKETDYSGFLSQMMQANPYFRGAGPEMLPAAIKRKFFDELVKQELIVAWANKNNVENSSEFKKSLEEVMKLAKRSLLIQQFEKDLFKDINVTDKDVEAEFNKDKDRFIKVSGGVLVSGVKFDDPAKANEFFDKVKNKTKAADFIKIAKEDYEGNFNDFGRISKRPAGSPMVSPDIPPMIRTTVFKLKNFPAVDKVKVGRVTWVLHASDKKDDAYFELGEIKPQIEMMIKNIKFKEALDGKIDELKKEFTVDINEDYFNKMEQKEAAQQETEEEKPAVLQKEKVEDKGTARTAA